MDITAHNVDFEELLEMVADATDSNDPTGALLYIAEYFNLKKFEQILDGIMIIHDAEGHMPGSLGKYRTEVSEEVLKYAKHQLQPHSYQALYSCL